MMNRPTSVYASVALVSAAYLTATAMVTAAHAADNFDSPLASHRANYTIGLLRLGAGVELQDVGGAGETTLWQDCDGWLLEDSLDMHFTSIYGDVSEGTGHHETWESRTGDSFFFTMDHDFIWEQNNHEGVATKEAGRGEAIITGSDEGEIFLPRDTLFPMQFLQAALQAAKNGERVFRAPVFEGGGLDDSLYFVSTLIGEARPTASIDFAPEFLAGSNDVADNMDGLWQAEYYPMRSAYFNLQSSDSVPEYEVDIKIQENGVVYSYILDDGDLSLQMRLSAIERVADESC